MKTETKYLYLLTSLYFLVSLTGILHHELWLDESHHWLLARDSVSFIDLIKNTRYEGHPILWNTLLFIISRFTLNPLWMQVLHILISTSAVYLFLRKAPFPWFFKTLFIFGYFMIFEYNLISRNYILGVLFLFLACSVFKKRSRKFMLLSFYLVLAANTHLMFGVVAIALFVTSVMELIQTKQIFRRPSYVVGCVIFSFGIILAVIQIIPPHDTQFFNHVHDMKLQEKFSTGFISLFKGLVTIPDFTSMHFWNSNICLNWSKPLAAVLGLVSFVIPLFLFKNRKTILFVYLGLLGTQIFFFLTQMSATRYDGMTFILLIMGLWIDNYQQKGMENGLLSKLSLFKNPIFYGILAIHFFSGVYAYAMDFRYPFTTAKAATTYLKENHLNGREIISVTCDGTLISPYLQKKVWFLCDGGYQSYCHWNASCAMNISQKTIIRKINEFMKMHDDAVYVSNYPIFEASKQFAWKKIDPRVKVRFLKKFDSGIVSNTTSYIYEISKNNSDLP